MLLKSIFAGKTRSHFCAGTREQEGTVWVSSAPPSHGGARSERGDVWGLRFIILKDETRFIFYIIKEPGRRGKPRQSPRS